MLRPVIAAALAVVFATLPLAAIAYEPGHFYVIQSKIDGKVLTAEGDFANESYTDAPVAMRPATGAKNQLWYVERAPGWMGQNGAHFIRNYVGGRVLHLPTQGGNAITYPRILDGTPNQLWTFFGELILNQAPNNERKCLDVLYANWRYGPNVGTWSCNNNANQQWRWVRKDRIVHVGDVAGRTTTTRVGKQRFVRPLTPQEADTYGIPGPRRSEGIPSLGLQPYVLHTRPTGVDLCSRIVSQGLANWRLPTRAEFTQLLAATRPPGATRLGEGLARLGWGNWQYWSSQVHPERSSLFLRMWPNDPTGDTYIEDGTYVTESLVTCVR